MDSPHIKKRNINTTILVDKHQPQIFKFDEHLVFGEHAVSQTLAAELVISGQNTPLKIDTSLFYAKKIHIVAPKSDLLLAGQALQLNLSALHQEMGQNYLLNIPCTVEKVEKYQHVTHATLAFSDAMDPNFIAWYQPWLDKHQEENKSDNIDESAFNFIYQYYKRLNAAHISAPLLLSNPQQIVHAFISKEGNTGITFSTEQGAQVPLPLSIFQPYISHQEKETRIPLYVWYEDNTFHYFSNKDHPKVPSKNIIGWLTQKPMWRVLLLRNRPIVAPDAAQLSEIQQYVTEEAITHNAPFIQSFSGLSTITEIINISGLFSQMSLPACKDALAENIQPSQEVKAVYQSLSFQVRRAEHRFPYKTGLKITLKNAANNNISVAAESTDISFLGLSIVLAVAEYPIQEGDLISIDFSEWNENQPKSFFKKKEKLEPTEYEIINIFMHQDRIDLGLKRIKRDTEPKINTYIRKTLEEIKQSNKGSIHNDYDLYQSLLSSLWVNNNITGLNFFLGRDKQGIRIIQAIVNTKKNLKICTPHLANNDWSFLQQISLPLDLAVNELNNKSLHKKPLNIGIYCYYDNLSATPQWHTKTDLDFTSPESKSAFIRAALSFKKHNFYNCSLTLITPGKDDILKGESSSFVSLAAHRLKEIHEICRSLIAIGELNDVTRLITFMYK